MKRLSATKKLGLPNLSIDFEKLAGEFRNLNPNDPSEWPFVPRTLFLFAVLVFVSLAGWWFVCNDKLAELDAKIAEEQELKTQFVEKKRLTANLDLYLQQTEEIDRTFGGLLKQLPNKSEIESLLIEVNQAGLGRGLQFDLFKPQGEQVKDFYAELPIQVKITGNYHDLGAFSADIAKLPRIVTLNNINITGTKDTLALEAVLKTFRYLDDEELSKKKAGGK